MMIRARLVYIFLMNLFIISVISLEINFNTETIKIGNLVLILFSLVSIFLYFTLQNQFLKIKFYVHDYIYLHLIFYSFLSVFWSPDIINTFFHSFLLLSVLIGVKILSSHKFFNINDFTRKLFNFGVIVCILCLLSYLVSPSYALQPASSTDLPELRGVFSHQLRLGQYCTILFGIFFITQFHSLNSNVKVNNKFFVYLFLSLIFILIVLSFARLYVAFALLSMCIVIFTPKNYYLSVIVSLMVLFCTVLFVCYWSDIALLLDSFGIDATLTGRTIIWERTFHLVDESYLLGFGYPSFDANLFDLEWMYYRPAHPHNSFLHVYFELGIIGLILVLVMLILHVHYIFFTVRGKDKILNYLFFLMLLGSLVGSNYFGKPSLLFVIFYLYLSVSKSEYIHYNKIS